MASVRILHASDLHICTVSNLTSPVDRLTPGTLYDAVVQGILVSSYDVTVLHFPPDFPKISPMMRLIDSDKFVLRANGWDVKAVLTGHTHDPLSYRRPEMKFDVFCAGTVSQAFAPGGNHFRILEIKNDDDEISIVSEEYRFRTVSKGMITNRSGFYRV